MYPTPLPGLTVEQRRGRVKVADFPAVFFHICDFDICHETQQAVATPYRRGKRLLLISGKWCSSFPVSALGLKDDVPDGSGGDQGGWKQVFVGQNVRGKDILQKNWLKLLISSRNGGSKILPRL